MKGEHTKECSLGSLLQLSNKLKNQFLPLNRTILSVSLSLKP